MRPQSFSTFKKEYISLLRDHFENTFGFNNKIFSLMGTKELNLFLKEEYQKYCEDFDITEETIEEFASNSIASNFSI